jgi:hypothetical protein
VNVASEIQSSARTIENLASTEVWAYLCKKNTLGKAARVRRGIEWQGSFDRTKHVSSGPKKGFKPGIALTEGIVAFQTPAAEYLDVRQRWRKGNSYDLPWERPKVVVNVSRVSTGLWCVEAFADETGLIVSKLLAAIWPREIWSVKTLAAVLNGPVSCAFVAQRERAGHISTASLSQVPLPNLTPTDVSSIDSYVERYLEVLNHSGSSARELKDMLLEIDLIVLRGYQLPPPLEREILNLFRGENRGLPFRFDDYVERMIVSRLAEQTTILDEDPEEQLETWEFLKKALDEHRLSSRKMFS